MGLLMNQTNRKQGAYMMRLHVAKFFAGAVVGVLAVCLGARLAQAGLMEIEAAQQANPALLNQWKFEGGDDSTRLFDSKGTQNLSRVAGVGGTVDPDGIPGNGNETV